LVETLSIFGGFCSFLLKITSYIGVYFFRVSHRLNMIRELYYTKRTKEEKLPVWLVNDEEKRS
jgi:hypothetical protein